MRLELNPPVHAMTGQPGLRRRALFVSAHAPVLWSTLGLEEGFGKAGDDQKHDRANDGVDDLRHEAGADVNAHPG